MVVEGEEVSALGVDSVEVDFAIFILQESILVEGYVAEGGGHGRHEDNEPRQQGEHQTQIDLIVRGSVVLELADDPCAALRQQVAAWRGGGHRRDHHRDDILRELVLPGRLVDMCLWNNSRVVGHKWHELYGGRRVAVVIAWSGWLRSSNDCRGR